MTIKVLLHHILIKLDDAVEADPVLASARRMGIALDTLDKREQDAVEYGTVVQVGPTAYKDFGLDNCPLKGGDRVSLTRYSGKKVVDSDGKAYYLFNDSDVLAIVD